MIDQNLLVDDFKSTALALSHKGVEPEMVNEARNLVLRRRELQGELDEERAQVNRASRDIGQKIREGAQGEAEELKQRMAAAKARVAEKEESLKQVANRLDFLLLRLPNLPDPRCPVGKTEVDNVVLRHHAYNAADYADRAFRPHWDVASELGIFDAERAAKISGSMFSLLRGEGARLLWALVQLGLDLHRSKYEPIAPPHFVRTDSLIATGHLPKFEDDAYKLRNDDLWAIPTGEVPLMSLHRGEILKEEALPSRYMAYTVCFRREAGSAGKDTRGMQRLHEFHKVELLILCQPERVEDEFQGMLADAEHTLRVLELPYRVVDLCTGDLTFSSARIYDLEVYSPGVDRWLECSSIGIFTDFQARRGSIRYRNKRGKNRFVHALNGSGIATPRIWAALIEHGQQEDGSVRLPKALEPYMGCSEIRLDGC